jgi:hypothetical protein
LITTPAGSRGIRLEKVIPEGRLCRKQVSSAHGGAGKKFSGTPLTATKRCVYYLMPTDARAGGKEMITGVAQASESVRATGR